MSARPLKDLAAFLDGAGIGLTSGSNLFTERVVEPGGNVPAAAVFLLDGISTAPSTFLNGAGNNVNTFAVQGIVRGDRDEPETANDLAALIMSKLNHAKPLIDGGPAAYITVELDQSNPIRLESDKEDRPRYSFNVTATAFESNT